jgi:succinate-acetate transporter protein
MSARPPVSPLVERAGRIVLRPIGNPLPLGFLALAGGTLVVSGLQLGWLEPADGRDVALILVAFVVPLQLLASVLGYLARDVVAGTGMGILAGTWLSIGLVTLTSPAGSTSSALGLFLLAAGAAMLVPAAAAAGSKLVPLAVLGTAGLRFALTGIHQLTESGTWGDVAGYTGLVLCGLGIYAALAMALEDARRKTVLPLMRVGTGREALEDGFEAQLTRIEKEAGIRSQL